MGFKSTVQLCLRLWLKCWACFVFGWVIWFIQLWYKNGWDVVEEILDRFHEAILETKDFSHDFVVLSQKFLALCFVWGKFLTPFLADTYVVLKLIWDTFSWRTKLIIVGCILFLIACYFTYQLVKRNADTLIYCLTQMLFFFGVAPLTYFILRDYVHGRFLYAIFLILAQVIPTCLSIQCVYTIYTKRQSKFLRPSEQLQLLSYWVCWPFIDCVNYLPGNWKTEFHQMLIWVIILCIWLIFFQGAEYFHYFCLRLSSKIIPLLHTFKEMLPKIGWFTMITRIQSLIAFANSHKKYLLPVALIMGYFLFSAFMLVSDIISFFVWRSCAVDSARVVGLKLHELYIDKICFWILSQCVLLLSCNSYLWTLIGWTQPFMLMGALFFGRQVVETGLATILPYIDNYVDRKQKVEDDDVTEDETEEDDVENEDETEGEEGNEDETEGEGEEENEDETEGEGEEVEEKEENEKKNPTELTPENHNDNETGKEKKA